MDGTVSSFLPLLRARRFCLALIIILSCFRLAHVELLWADEDYHLAAAIQILKGKIPYRDFWYDKPPLSAIYYLLIGGFYGWPLRLLDVLYILLVCYLAYRMARAWWGETEGWLAAALLAFFTTFYLPSAVISFAPDALMMAPHLAAIYCALRKQPLQAGLWSGVAFLVNTKAVFVFAVCAIWLFPQLALLLCGFALPSMLGLFCGWFSGALSGYVEQVWRWGLIYAEQSPVLHPWINGTMRTLNWLGFHSAIAAGAIACLWRSVREERWKLGSWLLLSFAAVCVGSRFAPHYFLQLLPPMVITASRGIFVALRWHRKSTAVVLALLLAVPFVRFGWRYAALAFDDMECRDPHWSDVVMDLDSRDAAGRILSSARSGDTLFVWGYRPDLYVYTRMIPAGLFWDSQPLTGVPADRHLSVNAAIYGGPAAADRQQLIHARPIWIVDGLGLLNPKLKPGVYPELGAWLAHYKLIARTKLSLIYHRVD